MFVVVVILTEWWWTPTTTNHCGQIVGNFFVLVTCILSIVEDRALQTLSEKNKQAADKWKKMSVEDKKEYIDAAKDTILNMEECGWGEASRILRNMQTNVCLFVYT